MGARNAALCLPYFVMDRMVSFSSVPTAGNRPTSTCNVSGTWPSSGWSRWRSRPIVAFEHTRSTVSRDWWCNTKQLSLRRGMTTLVLETEPVAVHVTITEDKLTVDLADGRSLVVPLAWYP